MSSGKVSNEQLYELLKALKEEVHELKEDVREIRQEQREFRQYLSSLERRTQRLETKIDHIHVSWNNKLIGGTIATGAVVSGVVAFAVSSFF